MRASPFTMTLRCPLPLLATLSLAQPAAAQGEPPAFPIPPRLPSTTQQIGEEMWLTVQPQAHYYFGWEHSPWLDRPYHWSMADMALGNAPATFHFLPDPLVERDFYRVRAFDLWSPGDADHDGMDDLWELHNGLDPVNAADASAPWAGDPPGGRTNREYYFQRFDLDGRRDFLSDEVSVANWPDAVSAEVSLFRFDDGAVDFDQEAFSAEVSLYREEAASTNFRMEAFSAEVSVYQGLTAPDLSLEALSAEVSVYQGLTAPDLSMEALSAEVSVYQGLTAPDLSMEALSAEVSVYQGLTAPDLSMEALSAEVSVQRITPPSP